MSFVEKKLPSDAPVSQKAMGWIDSRFPLTKLWNESWGKYYAPKNFNVMYFFGSLAALVLVIQIVTGIFLVMNYKPDANLAFASVEYIMREVQRESHHSRSTMQYIFLALPKNEQAMKD